ncbi:MAG: pyrroline-5-carboxylate reductase [Bacillota bacterium]|nr:pyrroline-5-carboxylate reductase [Bacillota bacterium]
MLTGFIGAGNMAGAIINGMLSSGTAPESLAIYDIDQSKTKKYVDLGANSYNSIDELVKASDTIILAVKPNVVDSVLSEIKITKDKLFASIAVGIPLSRYYKRLGKKVIRIMPNTPALVGAGVSAICPGEDITIDELRRITDIFGSFGEVFVMTEELINAESAIGGSAPAFIFMLIDALACAAVKGGIKRKDAERIAAMTVMGSAKMALESKAHPSELRDMVCSPGGTTIEGVQVLEKDGLYSMMMEAVQACIDKANILG